MNKFLFFVYLIFSYEAKAVEEIAIKASPSFDVIPYQFVVDAGMFASAYSSELGDQYYFVQSYASALEEILIDGLTYSDFEEDVSNCKKGKSKSYKLESCARIAAAKAVFKKKIPLAFTSFGYVNREITGVLIKNSSDAPHELLTIETSNGDIFQVFDNKNITSLEGIKCTFDGFLSPEGSYGNRSYILKRAFFVMASNCNENSKPMKKVNK